MLFRSNLTKYGSAAGFDPAPDTAYIENFINTGFGMYFMTFHFEAGQKNRLWKFNGAASAPTEITFPTGTECGGNLTLINGSLYALVWNQPGFTYEIWRMLPSGTMQKVFGLNNPDYGGFLHDFEGKVFFAYNDGVHGTELASMPYGGPATPKTKPGKITKLAIVKKFPTKNSVSLTWKAPTSNGGASITNYKVETSTNGKKWTAFRHKVSKSAKILITKLKSKTKYYVRISAINSVGTGLSVKTTFKTK